MTAPIRSAHYDHQSTRRSILIGAEELALQGLNDELMRIESERPAQLQLDEGFVDNLPEMFQLLKSATPFKAYTAEEKAFAIAIERLTPKIVVHFGEGSSFGVDRQILGLWFYRRTLKTNKLKTVDS